MCAYFTYVYCLWIFLSWLPYYLIDVRHFTLIKVGLFASLPLFAGVIGDTVGGMATDWLLKRTGSAKIAPTVCGHCRPARLRRLHRAGGTDRRCLYSRVLPHRLDVLPRMHHRPVLGGADGCRRQIFRNRLRHDEHGRQYRRRHVADRVRLSWPSTAPGKHRSLCRPVSSSSAPRFGRSGSIPTRPFCKADDGGDSPAVDLRNVGRDVTTLRDAPARRLDRDAREGRDNFQPGLDRAAQAPGDLRLAADAAAIGDRQLPSTRSPARATRICISRFQP